MPTIEPYGPERLEALLASNGWNSFRSADGRAYLTFLTVEPPVGEIRAVWSADGPENTVHLVRATSPACCYPAEDGPALVALLNEFHMDRRWPKGYLRPFGTCQVQLVAESQYPFSDGVHDELLQTLNRLALLAAKDLFTWMAERYRPAAPADLDIAELEERLRKAS